VKVLVIGSGGREHALVWKIRQSPRVSKVFCAPGNAGIAGLAECVDISVDNIPRLLDFARREKIEMALVGPEAPLTNGIVDSFKEAGLNVFGPTARAAAIEGSKAWSKTLMDKYNIPTAGFAIFSDAGSAGDYIKKNGAPCVVKADGLAAGKGVIVCATVEQALSAVDDIMVKSVFGSAGNRVIIEERLEGEELSVMAFTDGETVVPMMSAQDHKQVFDADCGPNTGGMGAYAPAPACTPEIQQSALEDVLKPMVSALAHEGCPYRGVLYAGLMITSQGIRTLEFNVRFGDPEAQPLLMLLETDLVDICESVLAGKLALQKVSWKEGSSVCVVLASGGYPGQYSTGYFIEGLNGLPENLQVFHAGTKIKDGKLVTSGGRVLGVTAFAPDIQEAIAKAYDGVNKIKFKDMHYRKDIGHKALNRHPCL
jgi:phosphoribosylamine--glycine ligase